MNLRVIVIGKTRKTYIEEFIHCKNTFGINQIIYLYKEGPNTVRYKGDLESGIKTKI